MKRVISVLLIFCLALSLAGCAPAATPPATTTPPVTTPTPPATTPTEPTTPVTESKGKVAIVTNTVSQNEEEYRSAQSMVDKYGDRIVHVTWPDNFMTEQEQMVSIVAKIAADKDVKALIINQAVPGTNAAVDKLLETRDDIFIAYCTPQENPPDVAKRADLIMQPDELKMGDNVPVQAKALGAKTLVHYSFPRHMSQVLLSSRRELMRAKCAEIGIEFVDATAPDPTGDQGVTGAQQFILEDVPKMVAQYGADTAFFSTNCSMQIPLIKACVDAKAIYPQPCCPSPYHGYPAALGLEATDFTAAGMQQVIDATAKILEEKGVLGRFSTWPVPVAMMATVAGTEYALKWIDGEVDKTTLDTKVLEECMTTYANLDVVTSAYSETDAAGKVTEYPEYRLIIMDFLTYGKK